MAVSKEFFEGRKMHCLKHRVQYEQVVMSDFLLDDAVCWQNTGIGSRSLVMSRYFDTSRQ